MIFGNKMFHSSQLPITGAVRFYDILNSIQLNDEDDVISWYLTSSNVFIVKSCYNILNDGGRRSLYKKSIWKVHHL